MEGLEELVIGVGDAHEEGARMHFGGAVNPNGEASYLGSGAVQKQSIHSCKQIIYVLDTIPLAGLLPCKNQNCQSKIIKPSSLATFVLESTMYSWLAPFLIWPFGTPTKDANACTPRRKQI